MDDDLSILLEVHNSLFRFPPGLVSQYSQQTCDLAQVDIPDFIPDQGTPNSTTSSLITPTQPLPSTFIFPQVHEYRTSHPIPSQPFPSEETCWFPSANPNSTTLSLITPTQPLPSTSTFIFPQIHEYRTSHPIPSHQFPSEETGWFPSANPSQIPFSVPSPPSTWHNGGVLTLTNPAFHMGGEGNCDPLLDDQAWQGQSKARQASDCNPQGNNSFMLLNVDGECHRLSKGKSKAASEAGPNRVKRPRKRQAPYRVDEDHEGAEKKNPRSQKAFQSEIPGYENVGHGDKTPKSTTKRCKKKPVQLRSADQGATGSSVGVRRPRQARRQAPTQPPTTPARIVPVPPALLTTIRRHAKLKKGYEFVEGWFGRS